jgi:hypothetical protein
MKQTEQDRVSQGQSIALGDTGDGVTGVPAQEQGISNRPGDRDLDGDAGALIERSEGRLDDEDAGDEGDEAAEDDTSGDLEAEAEI